MTSWWRHRVQISVENHLNEQAQERFHLDRKLRRYFDWVNVRWVNKAIKTAMWFCSTWMRCMLKWNRSWGVLCFPIQCLWWNQRKTRLENEISYAFAQLIIFGLSSGRARCQSHWFPLDARIAWRDLPTRAGCPVLDSVLLLFLKHTNIWFSYKVPFKFLSLAPTYDPATYLDSTQASEPPTLIQIRSTTPSLM